MPRSPTSLNPEVSPTTLNSPKAPGVRDIARATKLSIATVSRVVNDAADVAPATRQRVLDAVKRLGYFPNSAARALSTRRSRTIGAVIPTLSHSIFATFLNTVERELALHSYALIIATTGWGGVQKEARRARDLVDLGAEGLIVSGAERDREFEHFVVERGLPVVATSVFDPSNPLPTIGYDNRALGRVALAHLVTLGHRRIAVLHGPVTDNDRTAMRLDGVREAAVGLDLRMIETTLDAGGGAAAARHALAPRARPTALLCLSDVLALGALFEVRRAQLEVPRQMSVLGFDDLDWAAVCDPPLSTLHLPTELMGRLVAQALVQRLDHGLPIRPLKLEAGFVGRSSTAPPPGRNRR